MSAENIAAMDEEDSLSMVDVLAEQSRMQEDASAVLGDSDELNCTYPQGHVRRQALYACSTCTPIEQAGVCLACSYSCHEGHDLYELYTKRNFRCDCGNGKFGENKCKLTEDKDEANPKNSYNQNFKGTYCGCARPYPDPEDQNEDEMIQCVICEDWFHGRHLGSHTPDNEDYQEMTCEGCMDRHPFLWAYQVSNSHAVTVKKNSGEDEKVEVGGGEAAESLKQVMADNPASVKEDSSPLADVACDESEPPAKRAKTDETAEAGSNPAKKDNDEGSNASKGENGTGAEGSDSAKKESGEGSVVKTEPSSTEPCLLRDLRQREVGTRHSGAFWTSGWREKLCRCPPCLSLYQTEGVSFLLDWEDTVHAYEERGRGKHPSMTDSEVEQSALSSMSHVQKIEVVQGFNDMKSELREYLKGFADSGKVVGADDIKSFFADLERRKKERLGGLGGMQFNCK